MQRHKISNKDNTVFLEFIPELGGAISAFYGLRKDGSRVDFMRPAPENDNITVLDVSSFPLTPFSNRIGQGKYTFKGKEYPVGPNFRDEPHPNHGDGWTSAWKIEEITPNSATLSLESGPKPETPYIYRAEQTFLLGDEGLNIRMQIENRGTEELPFGLGHHPYFIRTPDVVLQANLSHLWNSKNMLPTDLQAVPSQYDFSKGRVLDRQDLGEPKNGFDGTAFLDHCFQGWDRRAEISWPSQGASVKIESDPLFSHFVLFVPQDNFFCAEPVSHATDAFNLSEKGEKSVGIKSLKPGDKMGGTMNFRHSF